MRARGTVAVVMAGLLSTALVAGCGSKGTGGDDPAGSTKPGAQAVSAAEKLDSTWPLTGLPVTGDESAVKKHPVMVLKMDNTEASQPQEGLGKADMVVEELVEGGLTRLAAFFYSQIPGVVGPVRSMRASDIGIVSPVHAAVVTSGAASVTIQRIDGAGIKYYTEGQSGFFRDSHRAAPYNLFTDMTKTVTLADVKAARPPDYLPWGPEKDFPQGQPARTVAATFSGGHTTDWTYDGSHYVNENSNAGPDDQFPADTVLVLRVKIGDAGYLDPAGNPVPETDLTGGGKAMIFHDGRLVRCEWSRSSLGSAIALSSAAGKMTVPAGHTWIELVPKDGGSVTFGK